MFCSQIQNILSWLRKQEVNGRLSLVVKHEGFHPKPAETLQDKHDHVVPQCQKIHLWEVAIETVDGKLLLLVT